jgi:hypothetical protein
VRGLVRLAEGRDAPRQLNALGDQAMLAMTIENPGLDPREPQRYQSLINLDASAWTVPWKIISAVPSSFPPGCCSLPTATALPA